MRFGRLMAGPGIVKSRQSAKAILAAIVLCVFGALGVLTAVAVTQDPVPLINQPLVPDATAPGGPAFTLTLNGTGFSKDSVVTWNRIPLATAFVSTSKVTATVPPGEIVKATTGWVTAVNPSAKETSNLVFFPVTHPEQSISMQRTDFATPFGPEGVATGDFNGDGKLDLAVANHDSSSVSVLLGNGDGTFQAHVDYAVQVEPSSVIARDFNNDGVVDLAVLNQGSDSVSILLGNGNGTFRPASNFTTAGGNGRMVVGDFNGDGKLDLAATAQPHNSVSVLLGNGDGTFKQHVDYAVGSSPMPISTGDLNGDGKLDLIVGEASANAYAVLLGNGDGTFQPYVSYSTVSDPQSVVLADFNGDGKLDLAVFNESSASPGTAIYLGNGDGTFQEHADYATGCGSDDTDCTAAVGDLNGDGRLDLVVRSNGNNKIAVFLGNGNGTFRNPSFFGTGSEPEQVAVGDFNGDGRLDVAVADLSGSAVTILLQR